MKSINQELSKFLGRALPSPFARAIHEGKYDYDEMVGQEGFFAGFSDRVSEAGSLENVSEADKKFQAICEKSIEIGIEGNSNDYEYILGELAEQGIIDPQMILSHSYQSAILSRLEIKDVD